MTETPVFTDLRRTFEWTCPECGSDHYDVGEVDGQILTCEGCSQTVLVRWSGLSAEGVVAEEPDWEWMVATIHDSGDVTGSGATDEETARAIMRWSQDDGLQRDLYRRHPATEWVPVEQEGAET